MLIRPYSPVDLPGIRWLHDRTPPAGQVSVRPQRWPEMLDDIPSHFEAFWIAVEMLDGVEAIVGMAGVQAVNGTDPDVMGVPVPPEYLADVPTARLEAVRVAPERQRRGVGRELTRTAIDWAVAHGFRRMILDTTVQQEAAIALYAAMGFSQLGVMDFDRWQIAWMAIDL
jgi:ribosomal protein S18 acetylase RimI-like enzyme